VVGCDGESGSEGARERIRAWFLWWVWEETALLLLGRRRGAVRETLWVFASFVKAGGVEKFVGIE
jgi:hypothetical protein